MKRLVVVVAVLALFTLASPVPASAVEEPHFAMKLLDVALVRPPSMVGALASTVLCVGLAPLTHLLGVGDASVYYMVAAPWRFTAARNPGDFGNYVDGRSVTGLR